MHRRKKQLTVLINYDTVKYMNKIQTWFSDLSEWFSNIKNISTLAFYVSIVDEIQDEMLDETETVIEQISELYKRVRVLELAESTRQFNELIKSIEKVQDKSKTVKKSKKSKK